MARRSRFVLAGCAGLLLTLTQPARAVDPLTVDAETAFKSSLLVQRAMERAHYALYQERDAKKAVQILEESLARINGNAAYLRLLRDAYRAYIQDLGVARQKDLAEKYQQRLAILDPDARPKETGVNSNKGGLAQVTSSPYLSDPRAEKSATFRAKVEEDPFDLANQRSGGSRLEQAQKLLAQAEAEYSRRRYKEACLLYEQASKADPASAASSKPRWAYCKLNSVVDRLNQGNLTGTVLPGLEREVNLAMEMSPALNDTGKWLLREIDKRRQPVLAAVAADAESPATVQHKGRTKDGWQLAETAHFRIFHNQNKDFAEKVAVVAERTRKDMFRKWFNNDGPEWNPKCDIYLHANAQEYTRLTSVPSQSPGHSRFENDGTGRVIGRRMDLHCDVPTTLEAVLPHETTHVVLAGQFGRHAVPRWADEGMAVLTEPKEKIDQHRKNLARSHRDGLLFDVKDLMNMQDYPQARRVGAFYAQSVVLVDFLTGLKGPQVFAAFLRDGLDTGYEPALRKHYGMRDFNELQMRWNQQVVAGLGSGSSVAGR
jgi:tetratricopeptide (TPR) repeat protein